MACRLQVLVLGVATLSLTACYRNHTADEEEVVIGVPAADAAAAIAPGEDGGVATLGDAALQPPDAAVNCSTITDPVQQLLCAAMQAGGTGNAGGLDIEDILGGLLGGGRGRTDAGAGTGGQISIEDILGGLLDGAGNAARDGGAGGGLGGLVGSTTCNNPTDAFTQLLCGLLGNGARDAGAQTPADPIGSLLGSLTDAQCRSATQGLTQIICFLRDFTALSGRRDGGVIRRDGGFTLRDAGARDAASPQQDAASPAADAAVDASEPAPVDAGDAPDGSTTETDAAQSDDASAGGELADAAP